ncbi:hypothetical protein [Aneurinibacillus aneurinilyticus]|uniref:Uncharacterized protein n=2 Tax=Aneurinibacillus aneurinilyticus TaxID=1391 RepID=A0A848CYD9_ANEAE|nr:hypothetical protein [Aneurinibacillus aneurinilyticus]MCI1694495.1 hypothetical protein [Aneurinibacillus aneurinilyticus]NME98456.1 hypothetical protein [Aneurinibacillus aneurinilyticus]
MKKLLALSLSATVLLLPQVSFAQEPTNQPTEQQIEQMLNSQENKVLFKAAEIKDEKEILEKAKKLSEEEIRENNISVTSDNIDEEVKLLDVYQLEQKLESVQTPDGATIETYAVNTVSNIGVAAADPNGTPSSTTEPDENSSRSVSANMTYYYYVYKDGPNNTTIWIKGNYFQVKFTKQDSQITGITSLKLGLFEGGNTYGGGRIAPDRKFEEPKANAVFGQDYKIYASNYGGFHYINTSDGISGTSGYFRAEFKRGIGSISWTGGIPKGSGYIPW